MASDSVTVKLTVSNRARAILDANRNALMLLDLKFSVGTLGLAMGTFCAGLYGMNLKNYMEDSALGFPAMTGVATIFSLVICMYGMTKLRKVQRIKMDGQDVMAHHDKMPIRMREQIAARIMEAKMREKMRKSQLKALMGVKGKKWF
jgi:magnesium transporter